MTIENVSVHLLEDEYTASVSILTKSNRWEDFDGNGETLSEAFYDLSKQLEDIGL